MADRYWVGGSSNWDTSSNWSATSGGAGGASVPTSADNVIFDKVATYTVSTTASGNTYCNNFTVSAGTVTFSLGGLAGLNIYGNFSVIAGTVNSNTSGSWNFVGSGTQTITSNGFTFISYVSLAGTGTYQLQDNFLMNPSSSNRTLSLNSGTLDLNNKNLSCIIFSSSGSGVRSISFGTTGKIILLGARGTTATTVWDLTDTTNLTTSGTAVVDVTNTNGFTGNHLFNPGTLSEVFAISLNIKSGTNGSFIFASSAGNTWKNVDFTGYTGTLGSHIYAGSIVYGNWTFSTGMTVDTSSTNTVITFAKGSGTQTITSNGKPFNCPITVDGAGVLLADALTMQSTTTARALTLANGTFDVNSKTISSGGTINYSSTGTVTLKNQTTALAYTLTSGTLAQGTANTFGAITLNNGTFDGGSFTTTASSITMATGSVIVQNISTTQAFTHTSGTLTQGAANTFGAYTLTAGTLNLAGFNLTTPTFITAAGTKNLTFNGGTLVVTNATTTAWNNAAPTNFTTTAGTGTGIISMTAATAKTFVGGASTYNCILSNDGAGALTITGANTFTGIANGVQPTSFVFPSSTTQALSSWNVRGTAGNLVTITSSTAGTAATLSQSSGTVSSNYLSLKDSTVTGGATWYAGANSTNVSGNTGWLFANAPSASFFFMF